MDIWGYYNPFMRPIQVDFVNIRAAGLSPSPCHSEEQISPSLSF